MSDMKPDPESPRLLLQHAQEAMQRGDRQTALDWAEQAVALAPDSEEPWLFLAALSSPRSSINYLEKALKINPKSQRARKGMHWAVERLRHAHSDQPLPQPAAPYRTQVEPTEVGRPARPEAEKSAISEPKTQPHLQKTTAQAVALSAVPADPHLSRSFARYRWSFVTLFLIAICVTAAWAFWPGTASPVLAFLHAPRSTPALPGFVAFLIKPTYTPSPTATFTPTPTYTPTSTATLTPTLTDTPTPTATSIPTDTPPPTHTALPRPTNTPKPAVKPSDGGGVHWIDVDLSKQMLYAYEGNTVVASFLVSTGVRQHPTVTGQFHIYIKYVSTTMSGDGYYLTHVPYTMYFYKSYGIHGTYWHHNFGHPMSHGCVNMYTPDAKWMYYWAPMGTLVNVHY
jgi:lipoprotein-anchoring transpeptidase ErfK/SrfK